MYRTIKITSGMMEDYEIIRMNAPDEVIGKQLVHICKLENEGKIIDNPYGIIEAEGYICNSINTSDSEKNLMTLLLIRNLIITIIIKEVKIMNDLTHLFKVGQKVICKMDENSCRGIVKETYNDHIIVDIPELSDHCWFEEGFNMDCVYPEYNFMKV